MALHKILKIIGLLLSLAGIIFFVMIVNTGDTTIEDKLAVGEDVASVNWILYAGYIMLGLVIASVLIFVFKGLFAGNIKKTLISLGLFLFIGVISYAMASGSVEGLPLVDDKVVSESASKWVGTGLYAFYILAVLAIGSMVFSGVKKLITK